MSALDVLSVARRRDGCDAIAQGLAACGHRVLHAGADEPIEATARRLAPDVIVVSADRANGETLGDLRAVSLRSPRPVVLFVEESGLDEIEQALAAGVTSYVVQSPVGVSPARLAWVIEVARVRFRTWQALRADLERSRVCLKERKVVERAKGLLMERQGLSESDAYCKLRRAAMNGARPMSEVAQRILDLGDLL